MVGNAYQYTRITVEVKKLYIRSNKRKLIIAWYGNSIVIIQTYHP